MIEPVLDVKDVVKYYAGEKPVLNGISFRLFRGETKIIIGASGSGRSPMRVFLDDKEMVEKREKGQAAPARRNAQE